MTIDLSINKNIFNNVYFPYLFNYNNRFEVYYGGAGSGKSVFVAQKLLIKLLSEKRKLLCIRKTQNSQKESCFKLFIDILEQFKIKRFCKINLTDLTITLPNNSTILFKGLDDSEKIKSIVDISDVWVEEATEITLADFTQLNLRLRTKKVENLQIICTFNPISKSNWVYKKWFENEIENDTFILKTTYKDNKFLPKDYIETLEKMIETNPTYYKIYALGEFCSLDKLIYNKWQTQDLNAEELKQNNKLKLLCGLDFGFTNDPTALIISLLNEAEKTIYIIDEYVEKGLTNDKIAEIIKYKGLAKSIIIADSAELKSIAELRKMGIYRIKETIKGQGSVMQGIQQLQQYKIIVNSSCINTKTELQNYAWKKDKNTGEYINSPTGDFNHCLDALRYSLQCLEQKTAKLYSKSLLGL